MAELRVNIYTCESIERLAEEVLTTLHVDLENIEITDIARKMGLKVMGTTLDKHISGFIKNINGQNIIYVNNIHAPVRQRFTVAHELGHFVLHRNIIETNMGTILFRGYRDNDLIEEQASRFGAALIMPRNKVIEVYEKLGKNIIATARVFRVSEEAMNRRLQDLGCLQNGY